MNQKQQKPKPKIKIKPKPRAIAKEPKPKYEIISSKNEIVNYEFYNFDKIIFFASGGFWTTTMNSCVFLTHKTELADKFKVHTIFDKHISKDRDYISVHKANAKPVFDYLQKKFKMIRDDQRVKIFQFDEKIPKTDIRKWVKSAVNLQRKIDHLLMPDSKETKIYTLLRAFTREIVIINRHKNQNGRNIISSRMLDCCLLMLISYSELNQTEAKNEQIKKELMRRLTMLSFMTTVSHDEKMIIDKVALRMGEILEALRKEISQIGAVS